MSPRPYWASLKLLEVFEKVFGDAMVEDMQVVTEFFLTGLGSLWAGVDSVIAFLVSRKQVQGIFMLWTGFLRKQMGMCKSHHFRSMNQQVN